MDRKRQSPSLLDHVGSQSLKGVHDLLHESEPSHNQLLRALILAASLGNVSICKTLLLSGADPNRNYPTSGPTPLTVKKTISLNQNLSSPLHNLQTNDSKGRQKKKNHSYYEGSALHAAIACGSRELVSLLLEFGAKCNIPNKQGLTAVGMAASVDQSITFLDLMLKLGQIKVDVKDPVKGRTALHFASLAANTETMTMLLNEGASVNMRDLNWDTPLILASKCLKRQTRGEKTSAAVEAISLLLRRGAKVRMVNKSGLTALHYAVESRVADAVKLMLCKGAKVSPNLLRYACHVLQETSIVESLLKHHVGDSVLASNLISLISNLPSKWTFSNSGVEQQIHEMARQTISGVKDPAIVDTMLTNELSRDVLFDGFEEHLNDRARAEVVVEDVGIVGYALLSGKLSTAAMLHTAGFKTYNRRKLITAPGVWDMVRGRPDVQKLLHDGCLSLKALCRTSVRTHIRGNPLRSIRKIVGIGEELRDYLLFSDLRDIVAYDGIIRDDSALLLNENYPMREEAMANHSRQFWIYGSPSDSVHTDIENFEI